MRFLLVALAFLTAAGAASAQSIGPAGWTPSQDKSVLIFSSPPQAQGQRVLMLVFGPMSKQGQLAAATRSFIDQRRREFGLGPSPEAPRPDGVLFTNGFVRNNSAGQRVTHYIYASDLQPAGRFAVEIVFGAQVPSDSPAIASALKAANEFLSGRTPWPQAAPPTRPAPPAAPTQSAPSGQPAIEAVVFWARPSFSGVGGMMRIEPAPLVLFKDGSALDTIEAMNGELIAHRRSNPDAWRRWRRVNGALEVQDSSGQFGPPSFQGVLGPAPANYRLAGTFRRSSGIGIIGGANNMTSAGVLSFDRQGRFSTATAVSGQAMGTDFGGSTGTQGGTYTIDGFFLTLRWANGATERRTIVINTLADASAVWIAGDGWVRD